MENGCQLCPRKCGARRSEGQRGYCKAGDMPRLAKVMVHKWEEPVISGERGSGAVFFSGCTLGCEFCQNYEISSNCFGKDVSVNRLAQIFLELQGKGVHNINLVSPTPYINQIKKALDLTRGKLYLPIVYNTSGYETIEAIRSLEGYVDVYLPDLKYMDSNLSNRLSHAKNYPEYATKAILEMVRQTGKNLYDREGMLKRGVIVRHMVLPSYAQNSIDCLKWMGENLPLDDILISIMSQYTPFFNAESFPEINRRLSREEYDKVLEFASQMGIENGFIQELSSAKEEYTPCFDLEGV